MTTTKERIGSFPFPEELFIRFVARLGGCCGGLTSPGA